MEGLTVSLSPDGVPDAFTVAGDSWRVAEEPVRWYERIPWWETETRMQRDHGRIDVEVWQLQLQTAIIPDLTPIGASDCRQIARFCSSHGTLQVLSICRRRQLNSLVLTRLGEPK